jgi:RNA polymerase sigma-70 factor, ECF subfamily
VSVSRNRRHLKNLDEETLIRLAQAGEKEAFGEIFFRYGMPVRKIALSIAGPTPELDDLVQDIFLSIYKSLPGFRGAASFSAWLFRIAVNTVISRLRKPRRLVLMPAPDEVFSSVEIDALHHTVEGREMVRRMYAILDTMSAKRRVTLTLFEFQGLSIEEISAALKIPKSVVKSRLFFARQELRRKAVDDPLLSDLLKEMSI